MMSLKIQQSGQLDILTRSVPVNLENKAVQIFIAHHGDVEAVRKDESLVMEFMRSGHQWYQNLIQLFQRGGPYSM